jgi:uncharacterized membrane protein YqgA involved in biofilm formation
MQEIKYDMFLNISAWVFVGLGILSSLTPILQFIALVFAIIGSFISITTNLPKFINTIKNAFKSKNKNNNSR